jgi:hypothetical protein
MVRILYDDHGGTAKSMSAVAKVGIVAGGYAGAFGIAAVVVAVHVAWTSGPAAQASSGMFAFGDSLLFLAIFGVAAIPATCGALFFLRPCLAFWRVLSVAALVTAATAVVAVIGFLGGSPAILRLLVAPILAIPFFLSALFAPNRHTRLSLLVAAGVEASAFLYIVLHLFFSGPT